MTVPVWGLDFRANGGKTGVIKPARLDFADGTASPHPPGLLNGYEPLVFLTHGFNVGRAEGVASLHGLATLLDEAGVHPGAFVWLTWPGDGFGGPLCYAGQGPEADATADAFATVVRDLRPRAPVHLVGHSLGCRVLLRAATRLAEAGVAVGSVVVMAAAVDRASPGASTAYRRGVDAAGRVHALCSRSDTVLRWAFPVGDLVGALLYHGDSGTALGLSGPLRPPDPNAPGARFTSATHDGAGHGDYLPAPTPSTLQRSAAAAVADVLRAALAR